MYFNQNTNKARNVCIEKGGRGGLFVFPSVQQELRADPWRHPAGQAGQLGEGI